MTSPSSIPPPNFLCRILARPYSILYTHILIRFLIPYFTGSPATVPPKSPPESSTLDLSSNFLPESFPEGVDPSHYALPVFLEEPKDTYAARGAPAVLTCQIAHALEAFFVCNEEKRATLKEEDLEDPKTHMKLKKISIEIQRNDLLDVFGTYGCKCHASSKQGEVVSSEAVIKQACKFNFEHHFQT